MVKRLSASDKQTTTKSTPLIVAGIRTPFIKSNGVFSTLMAHDLGRAAVNGLISQTQLDPIKIDYLCMGSVIADPATTNVAREIVLSSVLPNTVPAHTTTMACISSNVAATTVCDMISLGHIQTAIVGGAETFSDPPIRVSKALRLALTQTQRLRGFSRFTALARRLKFKDISLDVPKTAEFSTGQTMGQGCERLARALGVSRKEADDFAIRSHQLAAKAWNDGHYQDDVVPVDIQPNFQRIDKDNGPRADSTADNLAKLPAAFEKPFGINTAGNSSFLTDGASALLLMNQSQCDAQGFSPLAQVVDYVFAAGDPLEELLLGPALTIPKLLARSGLSIADIDVWELHEAFAAQIVANIKAIKAMGLGEIPLEKLNLWGGSLSLGHPFGATGTRLLWTAARRLQIEKGRYAVVAGCAAGALGSAILLKGGL